MCASLIDTAVQVAVNAPLPQALDYALPEGMPAPPPGCRVRVPLGRRTVTGVVLSAGPPAEGVTLRPLAEQLDDQPYFDAELLALAQWAAAYYHHPIGQVLAAMQGADTGIGRADWARLTAPADQVLASLSPRAHAQRAVIEALRDGPRPRADLPGAALRRLAQLGHVEFCDPPPAAAAAEPPRRPTAEQAEVLTALRRRDGFAVDLLHGVTGSGKTEVYLQRIAEVLASGRQVLVLVPEIALTPQLVARFAARFGERAAACHSALPGRERARVRRMAARGELPIVIGTRSAVFTPMPRLGLVIVDEEHDPSLKQQDGFRYHGRDLAIWRARHHDCPVILGSATPSLETLAHARSGRWGHLRLRRRANARPLPSVRLVDLRGRRLDEGLGEELLTACARHLEAGHQVLLFINRRGFAPVLLCHACGWIAPCRRCDARLTVHRRAGRLRCHHCGADHPIPVACPSCGEAALIDVGAGTQRIEQVLARRFPGRRIERVDSDRLRERGALESILADVRSGAVDLLVGTQILAKGHDFERLGLVGIVDVDGALHATDFRALERLGQMVEQVAGRCGRGDVPGEVLLQTHQPGHPELRLLAEGGYEALCDVLLDQRRAAGLPPFGHLALLRAESPRPEAPMRFLEQAASRIGGAVEVLGPAPAPRERVAGRTRAQLLLRAARRSALHAALRPWIEQVGALPEARRVRWSLDVDPVDLS